MVGRGRVRRVCTACDAMGLRKNVLTEHQQQQRQQQPRAEQQRW